MTEEHYQDGIKLPTDKDMQEWEVINSNKCHLYRFKVEGGYLYLKVSIGDSDTMCFVPDNKPELSEDDTFILMNKVAELSTKLNAMQDSLREFEKEKVEPLRERADLANECFAKLDNKLEVYNSFLEGQLSKAKERIQKLEQEERPTVHWVKTLDKEMEKLQEHQAKQLEYNKQNDNSVSCVDQAYDEETDKLSERIQELEEDKKRIYERIKNCDSYIENQAIIIRKLEDHHTRQIDENRQVSHHFDHQDIRFNNSELKLEKLEEYHAIKIDENRKAYRNNFLEWCKLNEKIEKLESIFMNYKDIVEDRKEYQQQNMSQPRNKVKLCPHGNPIIKGHITCTACY